MENLEEVLAEKLKIKIKEYIFNELGVKRDIKIEKELDDLLYEFENTMFSLGSSSVMDRIDDCTFDPYC